MGKFTTPMALALLATLTVAVPTFNVRQTPNTIDALFSGAEGSYRGLYATDGYATLISNPLSVSNISINSLGGAPAVCTFQGAEGSVTTVLPNREAMAVGPPQPQSFAVCTVPSSRRSISTRQSQTIQIRFDGDIPAKGETYSEIIPTDGTTFIIDNPLAVDTITSFGNATCTFQASNGGSTTVGAFQTILSAPETYVSAVCTL